MTPARRTEQEIKEMRERILDATIELARQEGLEGVSIRKIADRIGVSHMLLYSYFENRAAIIQALRERGQRGRAVEHRHHHRQRAPRGALCRWLQILIHGSAARIKRGSAMRQDPSPERQRRRSRGPRPGRAMGRRRVRPGRGRSAG